MKVKLLDVVMAFAVALVPISVVGMIFACVLNCFDPKGKREGAAFIVFNIASGFMMVSLVIILFPLFF